MFALFAAACAISCGFFESAKPVFAEGALSSALLTEARDEVPARIEDIKARLIRQKSEIDATIGVCPESFQYVRTIKRMKVAARALSFARRELSRGCVDGYAFALMASEDARKLSELFDEEVKLWASCPLAPGVKPVTLRVADFGAKGDGVHDDGPAFRAAVSNAVALAGRPSIIEVPKGDFYFAPQALRPNGKHSAHLRISGLTNCVLRGVSPETTRIRFGDYDASGCVITDSRNVTISNLELASTETPFTQGEVLEFDKSGGWVRMLHCPGSMRPDDPRLVNGFKMQVLGIYDSNKRQVLHQEMFYANRTDDLGNGEYRVYLQKNHFIYKRPSSRLEPGWIITVGDRHNFITTASVTRGAEHCNFDNVHVLNSRGAALNFMDSLYSTAWRVKVCPLRPELVQGPNADAIFSYRGEFIGKCDVRNLGDDAFNCMVRGRNIERVENNDTVVAQWLPGRYEAGDLFLIVRPTTGEFVHLGRVFSPGSDMNGDGFHRTKFGNPLPGLVTYASLGDARLTKEAAFEVNVSGRKMKSCPDQMYRPYAFGVGFIVTDCRIADLRGTGCVVGCSNALIEDTVFENMNRGIGLSCLSNCTEGPPPYNVLIRGNVFRNVGTAIEGRFVALGEGARIMTAPIRGVKIHGNRFENVGRDYVLNFCGEDVECAP